MNIFLLDKDPLVAAKLHCDKHVVKMIVEYAQLLSTAHRQLGYSGDACYKQTHRNHPAAVWARSSVSNYSWLLRLLKACLAEYTHRYGRVHATSRIVPFLEHPPEKLEDAGLLEFPQTMPEQYRAADPVAAYQKFYLAEKMHFAKWTKRPVPDFVTKGPSKEQQQ